MDTSGYTRLPGAGLRRTGFISVAAGRCRLFLGADHLLSVDSLYGSEHYKRFYFRDIQAFIVRRTATGWVTVAVFGGLLGLSALGLLAVDPVAVGFGAVFSVLFGVVFLAALIQLVGWGGTCRTWVQTAVQTEELPSLGRARTCQRVLARLQPIIQSAQAVPVAPMPPAESAPPAPVMPGGAPAENGPAPGP